MSNLHVVARFKIHDGKLDEFKAVAAECKRIVREKDKNTLQYEWFLSSDQTECVVLERYTDSNGLLEHIAHVGAALGRLVAVADLAVESFGEHSEELIETTRPFGAKMYDPM